jgi:hypothetical protein
MRFRFGPGSFPSTTVIKGKEKDFSSLSNILNLAKINEPESHRDYILAPTSAKLCGSGACKHCFQGQEWVHLLEDLMQIMYKVFKL